MISSEKKDIPCNKSIKIFENLFSNRINQYYVPTFLPGYRYFSGRAYTFQKKSVHFGAHFSKKGIIRFSVGDLGWRDLELPEDLIFLDGRESFYQYSNIVGQHELIKT